MIADQDSALQTTNGGRGSDRQDEPLPPPLEDMRVELEKRRSKRSALLRGQIQIGLNADRALSAATVASASPANPQSTPSPAKEPEFKGLKKGFLVSGNVAPSKSKARVNAGQTIAQKESPKLIRAQTKNPQDSLRFSEVQEAMRSQMSQLNEKDWMTKDFLGRLESNPVLERCFRDPAFEQAISHFQRDPAGAMQKYGRERPEFVVALREFAGTLGEQFEKMADDREAKHRNPAASSPKSGAIPSEAMPTIPADLPTHERELIKQVQSDPEVQAILRDPNIQKFLLEMRRSPETGRRILLSSDDSIRRKVRKLVDIGLLSFQA
ncbi:hypothetical protein DFJ73DRAFT_842373 [Zopfochytrium polystomum]|nr:hypothetical protein DFJ73DRAFT_842373 [Zopfochytrium polystomum]